MTHFLICSLIFHFCQCNDVTYYRHLITQQFKESLNYTYHTDASMYRPSDETPIDFGTFDFIIIGAGTTGSVITNRLSKVKKWKILLLEAGEYGNDITDIPNMAPAARLTDYDWGYKSIVQRSACLDLDGQKCIVHRGRGIGGTTLVDSLVYARGNRKDFDKWEQEGNPGWSFRDVLPYFKKSESFKRNDKDTVVDFEYHGSGGELQVEYPVPRHPLTNYWLEANKEKGYKIVDYNGKEQIGAAVVQLNVKNGKRADVGDAFIKPIKKRKNLRISTKSYVTRIITDKRKATGVEFTHNGQTYIARNKKEVILSAGVINSPQLLMLSGIGPRKHLEKLGIETIADLQVGSTLRDHPVFHALSFGSNYTENNKTLDQHIEEFLKGRGALTSLHYVGGVGFYQSKFGKPDYPDLEMLTVPNDGFTMYVKRQLSHSREKTWLHQKYPGSFVIAVALMQSKSVGTIRLRSKDPFDYPLIDHNFLTDSENHDIDTLYEGIKLAVELLKTKAYAKINATLQKQDLPACEHESYLSKDYWYCTLRYFTASGSHPIGTCPMGPDPNKYVVDSQAKVYGIANLRVADASIFPFTFSGHPNAPCVMVGEKVSDLIKIRYL